MILKDVIYVRAKILVRLYAFAWKCKCPDKKHRSFKSGSLGFYYPLLFSWTPNGITHALRRGRSRNIWHQRWLRNGVRGKVARMTTTEDWEQPLQDEKPKKWVLFWNPKAKYYNAWPLISDQCNLFLTFGILKCKRIDFCHFKPPNLSQFVTQTVEH